MHVPTTNAISALPTLFAERAPAKATAAHTSVNARKLQAMMGDLLNDPLNIGSCDGGTASLLEI